LSLRLSVLEVLAGKGYLPHLTLNKSDPLEERVCSLPHRDGMWSSGIVACPIVEVVPDLPVAVNRAVSMAYEMNIVSSKNPCRGLILVSDWHRVVEPIWDVRTPLGDC